jgi:hypothetical protein
MRGLNRNVSFSNTVQKLQRISSKRQLPVRFALKRLFFNILPRILHEQLRKNFLF